MCSLYLWMNIDPSVSYLQSIHLIDPDLNLEVAIREELEFDQETWIGMVVSTTVLICKL